MTHRPDISAQLKSANVREWRVAIDFPDYEVSNDGRLRRATPCQCRKKGAAIRCFLDESRGYPSYGLTSRDGRRHNYPAHILVARAFLPAQVGKPFALHRDDDKFNCLTTNLKWGDHADNMGDAVRNARFPHGLAHHNAKLTPKTAAAIFVDGRTQREIAAEYGVTQSTVFRIKTGAAWWRATS